MRMHQESKAADGDEDGPSGSLLADEKPCGSGQARDHDAGEQT